MIMEITYHIEVPVQIRFEAVSSEGDNWNAPFIPEHIEIEEIIHPTGEQIEKILAEHEDGIYDECMQHAKEARIDDLESRAEAMHELRNR